MPTLRVREWTKEQIEAIRDSESHSSHDSVIKSLLKDREIAKFVDNGGEIREESTGADQRHSADKAFIDLTVLGELRTADSGVLFLWCPNCENEVAYLTVDNPADLSVFEMECQRCLSHLDQHAIVAIEIGYPIEQKLADDALQADLKECVIDYWNRTLERAPEGTEERNTDAEQLVWQFDQYTQNFNWEWPSDVPVVGFEAGRTYQNTTASECIEVIEAVSENKNALDAFRVKRYPSGSDSDDCEPEIMDSNSIIDLILGRRLLLKE